MVGNASRSGGDSAFVGPDAGAVGIRQEHELQIVAPGDKLLAQRPVSLEVHLFGSNRHARLVWTQAASHCRQGFETYGDAIERAVSWGPLSMLDVRC